MDLSRQELIFQGAEPWFNQPMLVIGAGGIGSNFVYVAACTGFNNIRVYEPDIVGEENIGPQFYGLDDLTSLDGNPVPKTAALAARIITTTGQPLEVIPDKYKRQKEEAVIVVVGVDSMDARRRIWQQNKIKGKLFWLDGRMGGTQATVYCVDLGNEKAVVAYEQSLDMEGADLPCGMKSTAFITKGWMQGMLGTALYHITTSTGTIPFRQMYDAKLNYFSTLWAEEL